MHEVMLFSGSLTDFAIREWKVTWHTSGGPMRGWSRDIRSSQAVRSLVGPSRFHLTRLMYPPTAVTMSLHVDL